MLMVASVPVIYALLLLVEEEFQHLCHGGLDGGVRVEAEMRDANQRLQELGEEQSMVVLVSWQGCGDEPRPLGWCT